MNMMANSSSADDIMAETAKLRAFARRWSQEVLVGFEPNDHYVGRTVRQAIWDRPSGDLYVQLFLFLNK